MPNESQARQQVRAAILDTMAQAEKAGLDPLEAALAVYPGTPRFVLAEIEADLMMAEANAWWERVERTIDSEVIRNVIAVAAA